MRRRLNIPIFEDALIRAGLNQLQLAKELGVTRAAVSKWVQESAFPRADKLFQMGMLLGLPFDDLVLSQETNIPVVTYRRKGGRKTKDEHLDNARETGEHLKRLVKYLPFDDLATPPILKNPETEYSYVQKVATQARKDMNIADKKIIKFDHLIDKFNELHAVLIPTFWGEKRQHGNALNIYLPDSMTTWVLLNMDSNAVDFKFWMAHELGHCYAPELVGETSEDFADAFAQALLFPGNLAEKLYDELSDSQSVQLRIRRVLEVAEKHIISPYTIYMALIAYAGSEDLATISMGPTFMGAVTNFGKNFKSITQAIFKDKDPTPKAYIKAAYSEFGSPIFDMLREFCNEETGTEHFIHQVLGIPLADAKALAGELAA